MANTMNAKDFIDEYYSNIDLNSLKKLSLIIPTYNRNYYLSRCLWYHAHFPFGQIIVADSSPEEKKIINRETVAKVREIFGSNILYIEYEPETEKYGGDVYQKWGDAVQHVNTEYSIINTDKSFLNPLSCHKSIHYLDSNRTYSATQGMWFVLEDVNVSQKPFMCHSVISLSHLNKEVDNPISSFQEFSKKHNVQKLFSIYRSDLHKEIFQPIISGQIQDIRYGELFLCIAPGILGREKSIPEQIDLIRDITQIAQQKRANTSESSSERYQSVLQYNESMLKHFYSGFKTAIIETFHTVLPKISDEKINEISIIMDESYYNNFKNQRLTVSAIFRRYPWVSNCWRKLPQSIKRTVRVVRMKSQNYTDITHDEFTTMIIHVINLFPNNGDDMVINIE